MHFGDAREIIANDLHRISAAQNQVSGVGRHPDILGIGELHDPAHVFFPFHWPPDMRMRRQPDSHGNGLPADLVERVGEPLQLIVARAAGRAPPHVDLPMVAAQRLQKVSREGHMIGDGFGDLVRIDEICRLAAPAVGRVNEREARFVKELFEFQRIFQVLLNAVRVGLNPLQTQRRDPFDRPLRIVLPPPEGAGGSEQHIGIDGIKRLMRGLMRHRTPRPGWPNRARSGGRGRKCQS